MYLVNDNHEESSFTFDNVNDAIEFAKDLMKNVDYVVISNFDGKNYIEQIEIDSNYNYVVFKTSIFKKTKLVEFYNSIVNRKNIIYDKAVIRYYNINTEESFVKIKNEDINNNNFLNEVGISVEYFKGTNKNFYLYLYNRGSTSTSCCGYTAMNNWDGLVFCTNVEVTSDVLKLYKRCCT